MAVGLRVLRGYPSHAMEGMEEAGMIEVAPAPPPGGEQPVQALRAGSPIHAPQGMHLTGRSNAGTFPSTIAQAVSWGRAAPIAMTESGKRRLAGRVARGFTRTIWGAPSVLAGPPAGR